jgi:uncharacterized membrane protein
MMIFMFLGLGLVLLLAVPLGAWLMRELFPHAQVMPREAGRDLTAREILDRRYARGEVSREEYATMKDTLSDAGR